MKVLPKFLNKKISTPMGIGIVILLVLIAGGVLVWQYLPEQKEEAFYSNEFRIKEREEDKINKIELKAEAPFSDTILVIDDSGTMTYQAIDRSGQEVRTGGDSVTISQRKYRELVRLIYDNNFFSFDDSYVEEKLADAITYTITIFKGRGQTKSVSCYGTCPEEVVEIREKIEKLWGRDILEVGI